MLQIVELIPSTGLRNTILESTMHLSFILRVNQSLLVADKLDLKLMKWTPTTRRKPVLLDRKASTLNYMPYDHSVRPRVAPSTVPMFCFPHTALQVEGVVECCIACSKMDEINIVDIFSVGRRITKKTRENRLIIFVV
jgi:hypothetical protein